MDNFLIRHLQLQVNAFNQNMKSRSFVAPSLGGLDFPAPPPAGVQNGLPDYGSEDSQRAPPSSFQSIGEEGLPFPHSPMNGGGSRLYSFASAAGRLALEDPPGRWKYERSGSKRNPQPLSSGFSDQLPGLERAHSAPFWRGTGDAMGNILTFLLFIASVPRPELDNSCMR